jgi:competence protein ComEA
MRERPSAEPSPLHRLGALGLPTSADPGDARFVGGWVPEPEPAEAARGPAAAAGSGGADPAPDDPRAALTTVIADRMPVWLRGSAAPTAAATAWLAVICVVCVAVTAYTLLHHRGVAPVAPSSAAFPALPTAALPVATPSPAGIVVDVGGRVRRPGLVTLPEGARVADALHAAGGALRQRDLLTLNLAARVTDGELLLVGVGPPAPAVGAAGTPDSAAPVDINTATVDQLDTLPGVGPVLAQRIVDYRTQHGGFDSVSQLRDVSGIGDATYGDLESLVTV